MRCRYSSTALGWRRCPGDILNSINRFIARTGSPRPSPRCWSIGVGDSGIRGCAAHRRSIKGRRFGSRTFPHKRSDCHRRQGSWFSIAAAKHGRIAHVEAGRAVRHDHDLGSDRRELCDRRPAVRRRADRAAGEFAPYERGDEAYFPFNEVLRALDLAMRQDGARKSASAAAHRARRTARGHRVSIVLAHGGAPLRPRIVAQSASAVTLRIRRRRHNVERNARKSTRAACAACRSKVPARCAIQQRRNRRFGAGTIAETRRTPANVTWCLHSAVTRPRRNGGETIPNARAAVGEKAPASRRRANGPAQVTGVTAQPSAGGVTVAIAVSGNAAFEWHRLRDPDNRFWVDIKNAQLQGPPIDQSAASPLVSMRVRQEDAETVRIALSLDGPKSIAVAPSATGLLLEIGNEDVVDAPRSGSGSVGGVLSASEQNGAPVTPAPLDNSSNDFGNADQTNWKFGPHSSYVPTNPRLIVIDPGHGGSDPGTLHGGLKEADITLDMAKRLRDILDRPRLAGETHARSRR